MSTPRLASQTSASKSTRRQYPEQASGDHQVQPIERTLPMPGSQNNTPTYGSPYYSVDATYNPYEPQAQGYEPGYKNVDLTARSVSSSNSNLQVLETQKKPTWAQRHPKVMKALRALLVFVLGGFILTIPILVTLDSRDAADGDNAARQERNTVFWTFIFLLTIWILTALAYAFALILPYLFRTICHFVNPAYKRYWRVFIMLRNPIVAMAAAIAGFISMGMWFYDNDSLSSYMNAAQGDTTEAKAEAQKAIDDTMDTLAEILIYCIFWASAYFLEKILIVYLTIHYHYRSHRHDIDRSKRLLDTLVTLYKYSDTIYPRGHSAFSAEDCVIHRSLDSRTGHASKLGGVPEAATGYFVQGFGVIFGSEASKHWFLPRSTYATINRALQHPAASAALAKRLWVSLVPEARDVLTAEDVKEALGPQQTAKAVQCFETLDENENGDVTLTEMVAGVIDAGKRRQNIYNGMADMTHVINTLDWFMLILIAITMIALILLSQVPLLMNLKDVVGYTLIGASFVIGRTFNEIVQGAMFTILDHPYDVGDVCELWNAAESVRVVLTVKRISLLYTTFEEVGSGKATQYANMRSKIKRIANLTRSGRNQEAITFSVDHSTSFRDIELFKGEMQKFIVAPENSRDYDPNIVVRVAGVGDLNKLDIKVVFKHKSNFSNDGLRAARSSRMHCAIMSAARRVPLSRPGGPSDPVGAECRPQYTVMVNETEAAEKRQAEKDKKAKKRIDYVQPESKVEENEEATAKRQSAEEDAAREAQAEAEATMKVMGLKLDGVGQRYAGAASGFDQNEFLFLSGHEKGLRMTRRVR